MKLASLLATLTDRAGMMVSPKVIQDRGSGLERDARGAGHVLADSISAAGSRSSAEATARCRARMASR